MISDEEHLEGVGGGSKEVQRVQDSSQVAQLHVRDDDDDDVTQSRHDSQLDGDVVDKNGLFQNELGFSDFQVGLHTQCPWVRISVLAIFFKGNFERSSSG